MSADVRTTWRLVKPHAREHLGGFVGLLALGWISALAQRSVVLLVFPAIELLFPQDMSAGAATDAAPRGLGMVRELLHGMRDWMVGPASTTDEKMSALLRVALVLAGVAIVAGLAQYAFLSLGRWIAVRIAVRLREHVATHIMGLSVAYHGRRHFGDLLSRLSTDVTTTLQVLNLGLKDLVQEPLMALASLVICATISLPLTGVVLLGLVLLAVPVARQSRKVRKGSSRSLQDLGTSVQALTQMLQGIRIVKAFRAERRELDDYRSVNADYVRSTMKMVRAQALTNAFTTFFSLAGMAAILLVFGYLALQGGLDAAGLTVFLLSVSAVYQSTKDMTRDVTAIQEAAGASERIQALLDERPDIVEHDSAQSIDSLGSGIRFERVGYRYPEGESAALEELDLHVRPGETLALVGPSGSGKSTLVDLVARFLDPTSGSIRVDGRDLRELSLDSWTAMYAMVGQTPFLFHTTIEENIRYGRPGATQAEVEQAARAAGIHEFILGLPEGYRTNVADAGSRLSGGQRQRITIARAFLKGAPLLLLDEATSALDTESEAVVQDALERLMKERTVIVIAHRLSTIRKAHRIAVLEDGRLVEIGTHEELLAKNGTYARLHAA